MTVKEKAFLQKVKSNLILQHDEDDELLLGFIAAAVSYAETYQHRPEGYFAKRGSCMTPTTEQAVIMLWQTVNRLLSLDREVKL